MKRVYLFFLLVVVVLGTLGACSSSNENDSANGKDTSLNVLFMKQSGYSQEDLTKMTKDFMENNEGIDVNLNFVSYEALKQKIVTSAASGQYDVILTDAPWTAQLAESGITKDISDKITNDMKNDIFQGALDAVSYKDKFYGMPISAGAKYFYYNEKMLKKAGFDAPPKTWEELLKQSKTMKEEGIVKHPIVWSWAQAEALVVDVSLLFEGFDGDLTDSSGNPKFTNENNEKALEFMTETLNNGISNPNSPSFLEEDVLNTFVSGKAAFALNWMYMWNKANDPNESKVAGDVKMALVPGSDNVKSATINGGMGLAVTKKSKHPDEAWKYIKHVSSKKSQKENAGNALPIWKDLYDAPEIKEAVTPEVADLVKKQAEYLKNRPITPEYGELSTEIQLQVQNVLLGETEAAKALENIQNKAEQLKD